MNDLNIKDKTHDKDMQANFRTPLTPNDLTDADYIEHIQGSKFPVSKAKDT